VPALLAKAEWGTVPDWVAAFGTLAAFFVALRLLAKELTARREQEEDSRREQARRIAIWARTLWTQAGATSYSLVMRNGSEEPVYGVSFIMEHADEAGMQVRAEHKDVLPPGEHEEQPLTVGYPPGPVTLTFTDAQGRVWTRFPDGRLIEPRREPAPSVKDRLDAFTKGQVEELDS
jgi:hypothetical protein